MEYLQITDAPEQRNLIDYSEKIDFDIKINKSRDALLTDFGKVTLADRYLLEGETYQDMFARVAKAYSSDQEHAQRLYDYMSKLLFMPATPVLSNGGSSRGLPISCFLNSVDDSLHSIVETWNENVWLASKGGGIGTYWGNIRGIGEKIKTGKTSGVIPFIRVMDSLALAISQGSLRRGSAAVYLDVYHPEIEEFLEIRKASGDYNRKSFNLHHGINITNEFMEAVRDGKEFHLKSPKTNEVIKTIDARGLWQKILSTRIATGEPYMIFKDTVNKARPKHMKAHGLKVQQSNLCAEIMLPTGLDYNGNERTAVCCLSSLNAEHFDTWRKMPHFILDIMEFLDNVLSDFISRAPESMKNAVYAAIQERSVGLGLMGFHSYLQSKSIPFESAIAAGRNRLMFSHIRKEADAASKDLAEKRDPCPDADRQGVTERFSHKMAIAPTASISIICGGTSEGIEPIPANIYTHKTLSGSFTVKNKHLEELLEKKGINTPAVWNKTLEDEGSVLGIDELDEYEKDTFKTAFEINQQWIIEHAADRTPYVCQSQSVNLFLPSDIDKWDLHMLHYMAWFKGLKSLYYCRSKSIARAGFAGSDNSSKTDEQKAMEKLAPTEYFECVACT